MGALADLFLTAIGQPLSAVAVAVGVNPNLLTRIDQGRQPMPRVLAVNLARFASLATWQVQAACLLNTDLENPTFYNAIPPLLGEPLSAVRLAPTKAITPAGSNAPPPSTDRGVIIFFDSTTLHHDGRDIIADFLVTNEGALARIGGAPDEGDYVCATSGILVPAGAPTSIISLDKPDGLVTLEDASSFALADSLSTTLTALASSSLLVVAQDFPWYGSPDDEALYRLNVLDMSTPFATLATGVGAPQALFVAQDGFLYCLCQKLGDLPGTRDWTLLQINATPASEHITKVSNSWTTSGGSADQTAATSLTEVTTIPNVLYSGGDDGNLLIWTIGTVINPALEAIDTLTDHVRYLTADPTHGGFWGMTDTKLFRCNPLGQVNFATTTNHANTALCTCLVIDSLGIVLAPAVTAGGFNVVRAFSNGVMPVLLSETPVGEGPDQDTGKNNPPTSFALRPVV